MTGDGGAMRMPWPVRFFYEVCGKAFPPPVYQNLLDDSNKYRKRKADMGDFFSNPMLSLFLSRRTQTKQTPCAFFMVTYCFKSAII